MHTHDYVTLEHMDTGYIYILPVLVSIGSRVVDEAFKVIHVLRALIREMFLLSSYI